MRCPNCRTDVPEPDPRFRPFCSERCKMLDLGRWLDGSYRIEGEPASESEIGEELARGRGRSDDD